MRQLTKEPLYRLEREAREDEMDQDLINIARRVFRLPRKKTGAERYAESLESKLAERG